MIRHGCLAMSRSSNVVAFLWSRPVARPTTWPCMRPLPNMPVDRGGPTTSFPRGGGLSGPGGTGGGPGLCLGAKARDLALEEKPADEVNAWRQRVIATTLGLEEDIVGVWKKLTLHKYAHRDR